MAGQRVARQNALSHLTGPVRVLASLPSPLASLCVYIEH